MLCMSFKNRRLLIMQRTRQLCFSIPVLSTLFCASILTAQSGNSTVLTSADIYASGTQSVPLAGNGTLPDGIAISAGTSYFTFTAVPDATSQPTINGYGNTITNADGTGSGQATSSNTGYGSISGITAPEAGYLVGVFLGPGGPSGAAPSNLDFTTGSGTSFTSLDPSLDQVFFIGDGLTGSGTGSTQEFVVPTGATELYLGISDAGGYNGSPGAYGDNDGQYDVTYDGVGGSSPPPSVTPEPSSLVLLGTGALGLAGMLRRKAGACLD
jgi:hypothetical protein